MADDLNKKMQEYERETAAEWAQQVLDDNTGIGRKMATEIPFDLKDWYDLGSVTAGSEDEVEIAADYLEWRGLLRRKSGTKYAQVVSAPEPVEENVAPAPTRTMTLGELTKAVEVTMCGMPVVINFGFAQQCGRGCLLSWRGDYAVLALGYLDISAERVLDTAFYAMLKAALGMVFEGYKGGLYKSSPRTPVWIDNYGEYSHRVIAGVRSINGFLVIETAVLGE